MVNRETANLKRQNARQPVYLSTFQPINLSTSDQLKHGFNFNRDIIG